MEWERLTLKISSPCLNSYFGEWEKATAPEERSRLAALIRDLPEKKVEPKPEFKVGDWVKVRGDLEVDSRYDDGCRFTADMGPYRGKTGVITKERSEDRVYLDLTGSRWCWSPSMLEPAEPPESTSKFAVGDKVVPISKNTSGHPFSSVMKAMRETDHKYLEIRKINQEWDGRGGIVEAGWIGLYWFFLESDLVPYTGPIEEPKFQPGAKVVPVSKTVPGFEGDIATESYWRKSQERGYFFVVGINKYETKNNGGKTVYYCSDDETESRGNFYFESDLRPYEEPTKAELKPEYKSSAFKIGDKVKAVKATMGWGYVKHGDIGIITEVPSNPHDCYAADFPAQKNWLGNKECFELVTNCEELSKPAFKVGDRVRCTRAPMGSPRKAGDIGTISRIFNDVIIYITFDCDGGWWAISKDSIEPLLPINHCPENKTVTKHGATFTFSGPATICIIEAAGCKFKGVAKCAPEDTWKEITGEGWAYLRAMRKLLNSLEKNLREE